MVAATLPDRHVLHFTGAWQVEMPRSQEPDPSTKTGE
jgi:hypothetical protein